MADNRNLLVDWIPFNETKQILNEGAGGEPMKVKGVLQRAEAKNQNGRIYPKDVLKEESRRYKRDRVKENRALGELDHPDDEVVNLQNASHKVTSMSWQGNDLVGEIQVLTTPAGNILQELFRNNVNVGISSRGLGSVRQGSDGALIVGDDFELIAFDFVSNPSTHGAFMEQKSSVNEGKKLVSEAAQKGASTDPVYKNPWASVENRVSEIIQEMNCDFKGKCDFQ